MPTKPRAPKGHRYTFKGMKLAKDQRALIAGLAGLPPNGARTDALIKDVERDLSEAVDFRDSVERAPTDAGRAALLLTVEQAAHALERAILDLDQLSWSNLSQLIDDEAFAFLLDNPGNDDEPNVEPLAALGRCAKALRLDTLKASKKGRKAEEARDQLIAALAQAYHHHAEPRRDGTSKVVKFVTAGLTAGGFYAPAPGKLLRMIDEEWRMPKKRP